MAIKRNEREPKSNSIPYIFPLERKTEGQRQRYNSSQIDQIRGHFPHKAQEGGFIENLATTWKITTTDPRPRPTLAFITFIWSDG